MGMPPLSHSRGRALIAVVYPRLIWEVVRRTGGDWRFVMNKRLAFAALGGVGVLATGAAVVPAALATPRATSHTIHVTSVVLKQRQIGSSTFLQSEKDIRHGKVIGFDVARFHNVSSTSAVGRVAFASKGGFLYAKLPISFNSLTFQGTIVGGTGAYKGATGTVTGKELNSAGSRTSVTLKFDTP
jgi:hypothetical protein